VQAYVVGVPDRSKGEIVAAAVELRAGAATDPAAIVASPRATGSYKIPARLLFARQHSSPRTPTGKIHKPSLGEQLAANSAT
jgi:acyl-CoA synthetase (AMP-forming)/AMP-acid ligase II